MKPIFNNRNLSQFKCREKKEQHSITNFSVQLSVGFYSDIIIKFFTFDKLRNFYSAVNQNNNVMKLSRNILSNSKQ